MHADYHRLLARSHREGSEVLEALAARHPGYLPLVLRSFVPQLCGAAGGFLGVGLCYLLDRAFPGARWPVSPFLLLSGTGFVLGTLASIGLMALFHHRPRVRLPAPVSKARLESEQSADRRQELR